MHPCTQAHACRARHVHAPINPSPCILCTPHACIHLPKPVHTAHATCTHLPKPVHTVHATCMHPSTQARACRARHVHAPIYPSPCMLCTPRACTHLPKPVHAVHATRMHSFTQARACCARHVHAPFTEAHACGARLLHEPILLGLILSCPSGGPQDPGFISQGTLSPLRDPGAPSQVSGGLPVEQLSVASPETQCAPPPDRLQASRATQGSRAPGAPGAPQAPRGSNGHPRSP